MSTRTRASTRVSEVQSPLTFKGVIRRMTARVLDGQALAARMQDEIKPAVKSFTATHGRPPGLGIVLVGNDAASEVYVRHKVKAGTDVGFRVDLERLPATATLADALALVACTPGGFMEMLEREGFPIRGRHAVVIGRSDIVGKPMALLLLHRDATVTICHSRTPDLPAVCRQADILVAAVGKAGLVTRDFVKPGATVVDVAINRVTDEATATSLYPAGHRRLEAFRSKGSILVGDVHPEVAEVAG